MKKIISMFLLMLLVLMISVGCSSKDEKTEPEADLETESAVEQNAPKVDMKDKDALYEFVRQDHRNITRENFDALEVHYFDITGNGTDEAVLFSTYLEAWWDKMEIVSGDSGEFKRIPSDISLAKYRNKAEFKDGFLVVEASTGGTGEQMTYMVLYKYNNSEMVNVLPGLDISHTVAFPDADFEETGNIDGPLTNFVYTLTRHDNKTLKDTIKIKEQYTYNESSMSFDVKSIQVETASDNQSSAAQSSEDKLLEVYETNQKYEYDIDHDGSIDSFSVEMSTDDPAKYEMYLLVNDQRYDFSVSEPDLVFHKYKITKHDDEPDYVFVLYEAVPPSGPDELSFHLYSPNYSLEKLGFITPNTEIEDLDIKSINYSEVKIGNESFNLQ